MASFTKPLVPVDYKSITFKSGDFTIGNFKLNLESKNPFAANVFDLNIYSIGAIAVGDTHYLIASVASSNDDVAFNIQSRQWNSDKKEWTEDKEANKKLLEDWKASRYLIMIDPKGCESLEVIAKVCTQLSVILKPLPTEKDKNYQTLKFANVKKDEVEGLLASVCLSWIEGLETNPKMPIKGNEDACKKAMELDGLGMFYVPIVPNDPDIFQENNLTGVVSSYIPPFKGALPVIDGIELVLPDGSKASGTKKNWGGGTPKQTQYEILNDTTRWYIEQFKIFCPEADIKDLKGVYLASNQEEGKLFFNLLSTIAASSAKQ